MKELDEAMKPVLACVPEAYKEVILRLRVNKDWQAIEVVLALVRERILEAGKLSGDGRIFFALDGFDHVFKIMDKLSDTYKSRARIEKQVFAMKEHGGLSE